MSYKNYGKPSSKIVQLFRKMGSFWEKEKLKFWKWEFFEKMGQFSETAWHHIYWKFNSEQFLCLFFNLYLFIKQCFVIFFWHIIRIVWKQNYKKHHWKYICRKHYGMRNWKKAGWRRSTSNKNTLTFRQNNNGQNSETV